MHCAQASVKKAAVAVWSMGIASKAMIQDEKHIFEMVDDADPKTALRLYGQKRHATGHTDARLGVVDLNNYMLKDRMATAYAEGLCRMESQGVCVKELHMMNNALGPVSPNHAQNELLPGGWADDGHARVSMTLAR